MGPGGKARCSLTEKRKGNEREGEMKKKEKEMFSTQPRPPRRYRKTHFIT